MRDVEMLFGKICFSQFPFNNVWDAGCGMRKWLMVNFDFRNYDLHNGRSACGMRDARWGKVIWRNFLSAIPFPQLAGYGMWKWLMVNFDFRNFDLHNDHSRCGMQGARVKFWYVFDSANEALHTVDFLWNDSPPLDLSTIGEYKELYTV